MVNPYEAARRRSAEYRTQVAAGERCEDCGQWMYNPPAAPRGNRKCYCCALMGRSVDEVTHETMLRCPHCGKSFEAIADADDFRLCAEGEHSVTCPECERDFSIYTAVRFS